MKWDSVNPQGFVQCQFAGRLVAQCEVQEKGVVQSSKVRFSIDKEGEENLNRWSSAYAKQVFVLAHDRCGSNCNGVLAGIRGTRG